MRAAQHGAMPAAREERASASLQAARAMPDDEDDEACEVQCARSEWTYTCGSVFLITFCFASLVILPAITGKAITVSYEPIAALRPPPPAYSPPPPSTSRRRPFRNGQAGDAHAQHKFAMDAMLNPSTAESGTKRRSFVFTRQPNATTASSRSRVIKTRRRAANATRATAPLVDPYPAILPDKADGGDGG